MIRRRKTINHAISSKIGGKKFFRLYGAPGGSSGQNILTKIDVRDSLNLRYNVAGEPSRNMTKNPRRTALLSLPNAENALRSEETEAIGSRRRKSLQNEYENGSGTYGLIP